ncbi:hypothetical protein L7F22_043923 [Adiantum nelumboides]|nr:hypothetical protein [Adiantum nelumboides]
MAPKSRFASQGAFDALVLEDDSATIADDEVSQIDPEEEEESGTSTPNTKAKLSKAAHKRALAKERKTRATASTNGEEIIETPSKSKRKSSTTNGSSKTKESVSTPQKVDQVDDDDLEVMKTRSGGRIPRLSTEPPEERPIAPISTPAPGLQASAVAPTPVEPAKAAAAVREKLEPVSATISKKPNVNPAQFSRNPITAASASSAKPRPKSGLSKEQGGDSDRKAFWKKVYERTLFTFLMIGGFVFLLLLGHPYMIILVLTMQVLVYREVTALFNIPGRPSVTGGAPKRGFVSNGSSRVSSAAQSEDEDDDGEGRRKEELWSKTLSWYFFAVSNYFLYGESLIYYFKHIVFVDAYFIPFARQHRFLSFMLYIFGFMAFVSGLQRDNLKHQFGLFCWVHMSLLLIVYSSHFMVNNILEGLIWFFVPASLVICNDVFAYVCGMLFGRTPLISLSPKKTVEGFVGAFIVTEIFAFFWASIFQRFKYMICPAVSLGMNAWSDIQCEVNQVFAWHAMPLPPALAQSINSLVSPIIEAISGKSVVIADLPYTHFQLHALVMAAFASLVAPFGGFFASGFKRAFNIKDFGDSIPGHGGLTDRFDCQFIMGLFSYVYYSSIIREHHVTVGSVLQTVVTHLTTEDQAELYRELTRYLQGQGIKVPLT